MPKYDVRLDADSNTVELTVYEGEGKPYLYQGRAYRRADTSSVPADQYELRQPVLQGQSMHFDELDCHASDLKFEVLAVALYKKLGVTELSGNVMRTLGLMSENGTYSNAAALLADTNRLRGIDLARFADLGTIKERQQLAGISILQQVQDAMAIFEREYVVE